MSTDRTDNGAGGSPEHTDIAVVGAGFSGIAMAVGLMRRGHHDFVVLERAGEVGGTWRDNSYPGCACDVPSHLYSFSFAPNPNWSSTFSPQEEIQDYLRDVAREQDVLPYIVFDCAVQAADWDDDAQLWRLRTSRGERTANKLVSAAGALSEPAIPDIPGLDEFPGPVFHSAEWDHEHDLTGERVAVVGTGASAIQFVPQIQPKVGRLHLFQRTAPWITPRRARPITKLERAVYRHVPGAQRLMRRGIYWARELYAIPMLKVQLARVIRLVAKAHMRKQVPDARLRRRLTPDYEPGCKRVLISNDYFPSLAQSNVELATDGITEVRGRTIVSDDGTEREVDTIILGTGFHVTDLPIAEMIRGRDGRSLAEHWDGSLQAHRGTTVAGFPNLFFLLGPNTGLGHTSIVFMSEVQAGYILDALDRMRAEDLATVEARREAQEAWNAEVQRRMKGTVWTAGGCKSWYLDAKGRNTTLWPDFTFRFRSALAQFDPAEYRLGAARPAREPERVAA
jgi:cation diffusion facilitator CzcD-associated flavoprotein CzcO